MKLGVVVPTWHLDISLSTAVVAMAVLGFVPLIGWVLAREQWLWLAMLAMVALLPLVARWPVMFTFGVYAFLATSLDGFTLLPGVGSLTKLAGLFAAAALLGTGLLERRLRRPPIAAIWWGLFMAWAATSAAWAIDPQLSFGRLPTALSLFLLYLVAVSFKPTRREFYAVCAMTVLGGVVAAMLGYVFGLDVEATGDAARGRLVLGEMDTNPNFLGRMLLIPLAIAIAGFITFRTVALRALALGCCAFVGLGIFTSMSRGAVVAVGAMLSVLLYRMRARREIFVIAVLLLAATALLPDAFQERMSSLFSGKDATGSGRLAIWAVGVQGLDRFWGIGAGLANFISVYKMYVPSMGYVPTAHNTYLMVWVELGLVGLLLLLAALASPLLAVRKARLAGQHDALLIAFEAACVAVTVSALFGDQIYWKSTWLPWMLLPWAIRARVHSGSAVRHR